MSRHRFDHSVDCSDDTKEVSTTVRPRRIEVITGVERRRKWSAQEKAAIVAESLAEGAIVSEVARRHGLSPQQVFGWRARLRKAVKSAVPPRDARPAFVPAMVEDEPPSSAAPTLPAVVAVGAAGVDPAPIEIALGGVTVRVRGEVDPRALTMVLKALRVRA
ncbi:IS66-like element accessory protein TnpA [Bradyrhizobium sp. SZCCHNR3013]|uniref:IS66-like element accessory protein TnpA n=1 Tax=unclassified Bradyrhizobium TaxID=2631580 RepID=UPI00396793AA